jgi:hypothetical protein
MYAQNHLSGLVAVLGIRILSPHAQDFSIENVRDEVDGARIIIAYDLVGTGDFEVSLEFSWDGGRTFLPLTAVLGDVGPHVVAGPGRTITWSVLDDLPDGLEHNEIVFQVLASSVAVERSRTLMCSVVGTLVVGAAGYLLTRGEAAMDLPQVPAF